MQLGVDAATKRKNGHFNKEKPLRLTKRFSCLGTHLLFNLF